MVATRGVMAGLAGLGLVALPATAQFSDDFDDGAAAGRWTAPIVDSEFGTFDGTVDFAFDYSTVGIASAPNSVGGTTTGLFMEVNLTDDGSVDEGESIVVLPTVIGSTIPAGDFSLTMDVFYVFDPSVSGSTEYGTFGVFAAAPNAPADNTINDDAPFRFGLSNGNGLAWQASGDAGSFTDLLRYEDPGNADAGSQTGLGAWDDLAPGSVPGVGTGPGATGPAGDWVAVEISSTAGIVEWKFNGVTLDSFDNTGGTFSGGTPLLGYNDPFNSSSGGRAHYIVFDNVELIPEPATAALLGLGGLAMLRRRSA